jgi:type II secretory pathway component PulF
LAAALEALINAGVPIIGGWELAAAASGSPALRRAVATWKFPLETGQTPAELLSNSPEFPQIFANLYHTGEVSGQLDDTLRHLHAHYKDEGSRKLHLVSQWGPRIIYAGVVVFVGFKIISFYHGYFNLLNQVML